MTDDYDYRKDKAANIFSQHGLTGATVRTKARV